MARKDPDKCLGRWDETPFEELTLPWEIKSFRSLLKIGSTTEPEYTHQQIVDWSARFWWEVMEGSMSENVDEALKAAADIAQDIEVQWDLFLVESYSLKELQTMNYGSVCLPKEWFEEWSDGLSNIAL